MNASCGVSSFSAAFAYINEDELRRASSLTGVTRMFGGKSFLYLDTGAISVTCGANTEGNKQVMDKSSFALSVKLHNAFGVEVVDYHGYLQQTSTVRSP